MNIFKRRKLYLINSLKKKNTASVKNVVEVKTSVATPVEVVVPVQPESKSVEVVEDSVIVPQEAESDKTVVLDKKKNKKVVESDK